MEKSASLHSDQLERWNTSMSGSGSLEKRVNSAKSNKREPHLLRASANLLKSASSRVLKLSRTPSRSVEESKFDAREQRKCVSPWDASLLEEKLNASTLGSSVNSKEFNSTSEYQLRSALPNQQQKASDETTGSSYRSEPSTANDSTVVHGRLNLAEGSKSFIPTLETVRKGNIAECLEPDFARCNKTCSPREPRFKVTRNGVELTALENETDEETLNFSNGDEEESNENRVVHKLQKKYSWADEKARFLWELMFNKYPNSEEREMSIREELDSFRISLEAENGNKAEIYSQILFSFVSIAEREFKENISLAFSSDQFLLALKRRESLAITESEEIFPLDGASKDECLSSVFNGRTSRISNQGFVSSRKPNETLTFERSDLEQPIPIISFNDLEVDEECSCRPETDYLCAEDYTSGPIHAISSTGRRPCQSYKPSQTCRKRTNCRRMDDEADLQKQKSLLAEKRIGSLAKILRKKTVPAAEDGDCRKPEEYELLAGDSSYSDSDCSEDLRRERVRGRNFRRKLTMAGNALQALSSVSKLRFTRKRGIN